MTDPLEIRNENFVEPVCSVLNGDSGVPAALGANVGASPVHTAEVVRILRDARAIIAAGNWTKEHFACDRQDIPVPVHSAEAVKFCALGAIGRVRCNSLGDAGEVAINLLRCAVGRQIPQWNDSFFRTRRSVVRAFDRALALAEAA